VQVDALDALTLKPPRPWRLVTLARRIREHRPHVVQTWIYYADLLGGLAAKMAGRMPVVWGVHHSTLDPKTDNWRTRTVARICGRLSRRLPDKIVFVAEAAKETHIRAGYAPEKIEVIQNGFDLDLFRPRAELRRRIRNELRVAESALLVGHLGRFHPHKDHRTFLRAAATIAGRDDRVRFVLAGREVTWENQRLAGWIRFHGLDARVHLLGQRNDSAAVLNALDVMVCSSTTEAFPLAVGEAMACGVPCVVTDVGDSAAIVGEIGSVVRPLDHDAIAVAALDVLQRPAASRAALAAAARHRIATQFDIGQTVSRYVAMWRQAAFGAEHQSQPEERVPIHNAA
jgi:glycosyltransferase involved in cell wall biosynthesis